MSLKQFLSDIQVQLKLLYTLSAFLGHRLRVFRSRDLRRGTEPQMSLKQSSSHIPSGTECFYALSAFWGPRLSKLSANPYGFWDINSTWRCSSSANPYGFWDINSSKTYYKGLRCTSCTNGLITPQSPKLGSRCTYYARVFLRIPT